MTEQTKPIELFYWPTPNGWKISILLEELGVPYDVHFVNIGAGDQFKPEFLKISPNNRMPAIIDPEGPGGEPISVFESGAILQYLGRKFGRFYPQDERARVAVEEWLFWQVGSAPFIGGGFGHFYAYAPEKFEYPINRYAMETKRLFDVADKRLSQSEYLGGKDYTIADIASWPWLSPFVTGGIYGEARKFLSIHEYTHVERWVKQIAERPAVRRGRIVNKTWGEDNEQLSERHSSSDFDGKNI